MNPIKTSNIKDDFRICFAIVFFIIAIILIWRIGSVMNSSIKFDEINISAKYLWSLAFTLLGFCLLVLKICINSIHNLDDQKESTSKKVKEEDSEQTKRVKNLWRYFLFYPILISYSFLTKTLQKISKEVLHAITGVQAVEACRNNPDLDLVLMDIRMPKMDGNEATRQIRQFNTNVIIIAQTAYAFSGDKEMAIEAGCM